MVDIDPDTVNALRTWRQRQAAEQLKAGPVDSTDGHVFTGRLGGAIHPSTPTHWFVDIRDRGPGLPEDLDAWPPPHARLPAADGWCSTDRGRLPAR